MRNWAKWVIHHRMSFLLKTFVVLSYPIILIAGYYKDAADDVAYTLRAIDLEKKNAE